ncbi:hypothetical protein EPUS_05738 [Endocarpon pusillum Z07020]|uniref:UBC core domain-containing protein n=1 Tax=Endocarpon pusillum (strain Z07020 / HMAS-L-300199) TaxID=1263415 RepID=U1FV54_ENDPU|nr:uncharacterized protein EPUS_05738 [Endocarpon pusillum Z07020]ERF68677.1 hypothetical protein EPUS_05738 [Endocarpon pusillum Z07020]
MVPSTTVRRLLREVRELSAASSNPNPSFHAHPVSDEDLFEWHFTLLGPPSPSPYAGGLYHGRISLPLTYPLKPPNFRFLTPSGRFEVNREICLSISGFHEESWMPAWGIRTALVALRTFMGEQGTAGQVGGMEASENFRNVLAKSSRQWRCDGCGGKTNEEIMRDWWDICREKGINVGEEVGLEELPEGLRLGFKDQIGKDEKKKSTERTTPSELTGHSESVGNRDISARNGGTAPVAFKGTSSTSDPARTNALSEPLAEASNAASGGASRSSSSTPSSDTQRTSNQPAVASSPVARPITAQSTTTIPTSQPPRPATPMLDKAISGLVLALLFMVLKKVLYNPNVIGYDY